MIVPDFFCEGFNKPTLKLEKAVQCYLPLSRHLLLLLLGIFMIFDVYGNHKEKALTEQTEQKPTGRRFLIWENSNELKAKYSHASIISSKRVVLTSKAMIIV